jgi:hypothetical protein
MSGVEVTAEAAIVRVRALWPAVTTGAASDAFLEAWLTWAQAQVGEIWTYAKALDGVAHLLAHIAYKVDPGSLLGGSSAGAAGPVTSLSTLSLSASFGDAAGLGGYTGSDADLSTTGPGRSFLTLRNTLAGVHVPMMGRRLRAR